MNFKSFMIYVNFTYFFVQFLSCSEVFCLHDFWFITLRVYELLCTVFSTTKVFSFSFFLFFSSEQLYYQNRRYRKQDMWILCRSHCFSNLCTPTSGPNITPFIPLGLSARECEQQTAHIIRNETKYSSAHSKLQWRNPSQGCIKHAKKVTASTAGHSGLFQHLIQHCVHLDCWCTFWWIQYIAKNDSLTF
jgi:hypothetical protein